MVLGCKYDVFIVIKKGVSLHTKNFENYTH